MWASGRQGNVPYVRTYVAILAQVFLVAYIYARMQPNISNIVAMSREYPLLFEAICSPISPTPRLKRSRIDFGISSETGSLGSQPRASVSAKQFADVLRMIHQLGILELLAHPWCYGETVRVSSSNSADDADPSQIGVVQWPSEAILKDWAVTASSVHSWHYSKGWSPSNSLAVMWDDGIVRYYKADCNEGLHDLVVVLPPTKCAGNAPELNTFFQVLGTAPIEEVDPAFRRVFRHGLGQWDAKHSFICKKSFWKERMDRYESICSKVAARNVQGAFTPLRRQQRKRMYLDFAHADFLQGFVAQHRAPEWWDYRALMGL